MAETTKLPNGWEETTLGAVGTFYRGHGGTREDEMPHGLPCVRYGDLYTHHDFIIRSFASFIKPTRASSYFPLKPGDLVFAASGETFEEIGKAAVYCDQAPAFAGGDTIIFRPLPQLDPCFAGYAVNGLIANRHKARHGQGSSVIHIGTGHLAALPIALPPHSVQQRIAHCLQTIDQAIEKTKALIEKYQQIKAGLMHDLFTRGIGPDGKLRPPREQAPELYQETPIGWIPREWSVEPLRQVCSSIVDCPHSTPTFLPGGKLVVRTMHVRDGAFLENIASRVSEDEFNRRNLRALPQVDDVVFTREAPVGEAFVVPKGLEICLGQRVMLFRPISGRLNSVYLVAQIYGGSLRSRINELTAGTTNPHVNVADMTALPVALPPLEEQGRIAQRISGLSRMMASEEAHKKKLMAQKAGLMHDLLTGKVPVNPDPPEPADA